MKNLSRLARTLCVLIAVLTFALGSTTPAFAQTGSGWSGGTSSDMQTSSNWDNGFGSNFNLFFGARWNTNGRTGSTSVVNGSAYSGYRLNFESIASPVTFTLSGSAITLFDFGGNAAQINNSSTANQQLNNSSITFKPGTSGASINATNGNLTFGATAGATTGKVNLDDGNGAFQLNLTGGSSQTILFNAAVNNQAGTNGLRIAVTGDESVTFAGGLSGGGDFLKQGAGTALFTTNTTSFTGGVFIDNGVVAVGSGGSIGTTNGTTTGLISMGSTSATQSANNTTVNIANSGVTLANPIDARFLTGQTNGVKTIGGTFTSGSSTYSGGITLHDNVVLSAANGGTVIFSGIIATAGSGTTTVLPTGITFGGTPDVQINTGANSTGIVEYDNAMTYAADTFVNSGTLQFNGAGSLANSTIRLGQLGGATLNMIAPGGSTLNVTVNVRSSTGTKTISASNTSGTATLGGHFALDDNATVTEASSTGTLAITQARAGGAGTITGTDIKGFTLTLTPTGTINISGDVYNSVNSGSILMNGTGTATLNGVANTYSGTTTLSSGTLQGSTTAFSATPLSPFGTSALALNGGILQLRTPGATGSGTGNTTAETVTFGNNTTVGGTTTIDVDRTAAATAATSKTIALGTLSIGANTLNVTGIASHAYALSFGATSVTGAAIFNPTGANLTLGDITGGVNTIGITRSAGTTGIVTFTGANDNTGGLVTISSGELDLNKTAGKNGIGGSGVNVSGGTLKLLASNQIADAATVSVGTSGTFNNNGNTETINGLSLTGGATVSGAGPLLLNSGGVTIDASTAAPTISANVTINQAQTWSSNSSTNSTNVSGSANNFANLLTLNGGSFTFSSGASSAGAGGVKITGGTTVINGAGSGNPFFGSGTVEFNSGTFGTSAGTKTLNNAFSITGDFTFNSPGGGNNTFTGVGSTTGNRIITANTATTSFTTNALTLGGNLTTAGSGALTLSGGLNLGAVDRTITGGATGATSISGAIDSSAAGHKLVLGGDKVVLFSAATGATNTVNFEVNAPGVVTFGLGGTNTYAGNTTGTAGTLAIAQSGVVTAGVIASGPVGKGTLTLNNGTILRSNNTTGRTLENNLSLSGAVTLGDATNNGALTFDSTGLTAPSTVSLTAATSLAVASSVTIANAITGGSNTLSKSGAGTLTFSGGAANTYTGLTTISGGELDLGKTAGVNAVAGDGVTTTNDVTVSGGTLKWLANEQVQNTTTITLNSGTVDLGGKTETLGTFINNGGTFQTGVGGSLIGTTATINWSGGTNTVNADGTVIDNHIVINGGTNTVQGKSGPPAGTTRGGVVQLNSGGTGLEMTGGALTLNSDAASAGQLLLKGNLISHASATTSTIDSGGNAANAGNVDLNGGTRIFTVEDGAAAVDLSVSALVQNGGIDKEGPGVLALSGANTYTGGTSLGGGSLYINSAAAIGTGDLMVTAAGTTIDNTSANAITFANNNTVDLTGGNLTFTGTKDISTGTGGLVMAGADRSVTVTNSAATLTVGGVVSDNGGTRALTKAGAGTLLLTGSNIYTGATSVATNGGTLTAGASGALGTTSGITVNGGGTLAISGSGNLDRINDAAGITLAGGTFARSGTGTVSEGVGAVNNGGTITGSSTVGLGALTLSATSNLDFGTGGVGTLVFSTFAPNGFVLNILNYSSTANAITPTSGTDGVDDRLIFNQDQSPNLGFFNFGGGLSAQEIALDNGFFEITAVPEPGTWVAGALVLGVMAFTQRRRFARKA